MARKNKDFCFDWGGHMQQTVVWSYLDVVAAGKGSVCIFTRQGCGEFITSWRVFYIFGDSVFRLLRVH